MGFLFLSVNLTLREKFRQTKESLLSRHSHSRLTRRILIAPMLRAARAWLLSCHQLGFLPRTTIAGQHHAASSEVSARPLFAMNARRACR
jgi:hypothetical protein